MGDQAVCGIIGVAARTPVANREWLAEGRDAMRHRGPDDSGEWWSDDFRVGLGHQRLSIIDLSGAAHQPMLDADASICIVFNGEIYNFMDLREELSGHGHTFRSHSDTEVILAAYREWGTECLSKLNGMFAFAIFDARKKSLFLARDRAGEKPLYYSATAHDFRFASELKGLMADPAFVRQVDRESLDCYLAMGFIPGERCILRGVKKLAPGHALEVDLELNRIRTWRYWQLPESNHTGAKTADETELLEELESLLEDAVKRQLVADVPIGVLLSGGVDSSLVTAMAARTGSHIRTFTIRFPGHGIYDETAHAQLVADHFGTEHLTLDANEVTPELLPQLAAQFDEPMSDSSMIPTFLVSQLVRGHCTVALGGDGGDELFGGYTHYDQLLWLYEKSRSIPIVLRRLLASTSSALLPVGFRGRNYLQAVGADLSHEMPLILSFLDARTRRKLMSGHQNWPTVAETIRGQCTSGSKDLIERATRMDFDTYLPEDILVKVDRASMLCSLEVRAPLLDYRLAEFAFGKVPSRLKATASGRKILLKKLAARVLPAEFDEQRKQGFSIPLPSWLKSGPWLDRFREILLDSTGSFFDQGVVQSLLEGQAKGRANSERLFSLVLFELWRHEYGISG